ncbi:hypothetical protein ACIRFH_35280 [Streptomyces sp. NPDC093586]
MEEQQRYVIGKRDENGTYPVTVDQTPADTAAGTRPCPASS